jgi:pectinesterase
MNGQQPFRIGVDVGYWHEKLVIDRPNVHLIGTSREACVLGYDAAAGSTAADGTAWGTWGCASITVRAPDFTAENLSIENRFDYLGHLAEPEFPQIGPNGAQAVALMLDTGADRSCLVRVNLTSHQDTLFADAGRSWFHDCRISGSVDFIFGAGCAVFESCHLVSRFRPGKPRQGYVAAPSTPISQDRGLTFHRCRLLRERAVPDASVALGRAWRPGKRFADGQYGDPQAVGCASYLSCWMDAHIAPEGWDAMAYSARDGSRVMLDPIQARLFEFDSRGPGAHRSASRRWMDATAARQHLPVRALSGWRPVVR